MQLGSHHRQALAKALTAIFFFWLTGPLASYAQTKHRKGIAQEETAQYSRREHVHHSWDDFRQQCDPWMHHRNESRRGRQSFLHPARHAILRPLKQTNWIWSKSHHPSTTTPRICCEGCCVSSHGDFPTATAQQQSFEREVQ
jgi:hypothetical protein